MAALNFPSNPTLNQTYTAGEQTWIWDGERWGLSNNYVRITGGDVMTGYLTLVGNPTSDLQAVPRQYVIQYVGDYAVPKSGGTMTGLLTLSGAPTSNLHAATKQYVDSKASNEWSIKTTDYTAVANDRVFADTSAGSFTITLPSTPVDNTQVVIADAKGYFDRFPLAVNGNGVQIMNDSSNLIVNVKNAALTFVYKTGLNWRIV